MNIFFLDKDPVLAARMMHDKHVVKMVLETAQILSTVTGVGYKPTHQNHPCVRWAGDHGGNFSWLACHGAALADEYRHRYGRTHKSEEIIYRCSALRPVRPGATITEPAQAMPEQYRVPGDAVAAYRAYYLGEKVHQSRWTRRPVPEFVSQGNPEMAKKQVKQAETEVPASTSETTAQADAPEAKKAVGVRGPKGVSLDAKITLLAAQNPKRPGSKAHGVFSKYVDGMTIQQFLDANGGDDYATPNLVYDAAHGFIAIEGYTPKPVAPKKAREPKAPKEPKAKKVKAAAADPATPTEVSEARAEVESATVEETVD